jgi:NAD(P) transhydrogenase subunit beta
LRIGGGIGAVMARKVPMTDMPQLVAAFHSLVGLAAVLVAAGALLCAGSLRHRRRRQHPQSSAVEMSLGVAIGALTFTGSVIAFAKLNGNMSGAPIILPMRATSSTSRSACADLLHLRPGSREPGSISG